MVWVFSPSDSNLPNKIASPSSPILPLLPTLSLDPPLLKTLPTLHVMQHPSASERDISNVMNYITLTQTLVESYFALADEVQVLTDRNTILEHKLRYAHEQVS